MTTLYCPVLIETAEQAERLPDGAILHRGRGASGLTGMVLRSPHTGQTYFRVGVDHWPVSRVVDTFAEALVPIEAEEETCVIMKAANSQDSGGYPYAEASMDLEGNVWFDNGLERVDVTNEFNEWVKQHARTRYVTPWEPRDGLQER